MSPACASLLSDTRPLLERCCVAALSFFMHEAVAQQNVEDSQVRVLSLKMLTICWLLPPLRRGIMWTLSLVIVDVQVFVVNLQYCGPEITYLGLVL